MKVDVVMCTWNSNKPYFVKCLNSIKRELPSHCFILVDRFSTDGTVETVKKVFSNAKIIESNEKLGVSRKLGIELVDTEFFVFVDSDVELCKGWFQQVISHLDSKTGAVQGTRTDRLKHRAAWVEWSRDTQARFKKTWAGKVIIATSKNPSVLKGDPCNTLIRTCLVKDYDPPVNLSAAEGHLLQRCVLRKGYKWKAIRDPIAIHYGYLSLADEIRRIRWDGAGERLTNLENMSIWSLTKNSLTQCISALFASLYTKKIMILVRVTLGQFARIQGWVNWIKYLELER